VFRSRTRDQWCEHFEGVDACFAPVLDFAEVPDHAHHRARSSHPRVEGIVQPAPAPRFARTPASVRGGPPERGAGGRAALADWGFTPAEIENLVALGAGLA